VRRGLKSFLAKAVPRSWLKSVSVGIRDNEFFTLLGPSGCGKTTLLRLIAGFEAPTAGRIHIGAQDVAALPPQKRPVNTVFQSYALFPHLNVAENVAFGLQMRRGRLGDGVRAETPAMVRLEGLPAQAAQLGRPAARGAGPCPGAQPSVLLLESRFRPSIWAAQGDASRGASAGTGITFVLVTRPGGGVAMSDRIAVMRDGHPADRPAEGYLRQLSCRFVADFVGEANLIPGPSPAAIPRSLLPSGRSASISRKRGAGRSGKISNVTSSARTRSTK
jgi:spermidine/putrescine transport system ATP-binding protein